MFQGKTIVANLYDCDTFMPNRYDCRQKKIIPLFDQVNKNLELWHEHRRPYMSTFHHAGKTPAAKIKGIGQKQVETAVFIDVTSNRAGAIGRVGNTGSLCKF